MNEPVADQFYDWGIAHPRKGGIRQMPTEWDARETVRIAVETWGGGIGWTVMRRKLGAHRDGWEIAP